MVRHRHDEAADILLRAGADPWRPVVGGRSAGRVALDGPLADLFAGLPGAPVVTEEERQRQLLADALMFSYHPVLSDLAHPCVAFCRGPDAEDAVRRLRSLREKPRGGTLWVRSLPGGGLVLVGGTWPLGDTVLSVMSEGGSAAGVFDNPIGGDQAVRWWRDGAFAGRFTTFEDPPDNAPNAAWLCRFGEQNLPFGTMAQNLALMTLLTGVKVGQAALLYGPNA